MYEEDNNWVYETGISIEIPPGYVGLIFPRSSIANRNALQANSVSVIDSGYRGMIYIKHRNTERVDSIHHEPYKVGDRVAQLIILPYPKIEFVETDRLTSSDRDTDGWGSTGY
jgi:dUTP pyrophosphatase